MSAATSTFSDHTAALRNRIETALEALSRPAAGCPPRLAEAMRYSLLAGGKRLRPLLVLLGTEACGAPVDAALPAACAVEMVHTYSLVHDDLPAMDDDELRRGRATNHVVYGEATAILAGDGLLTLAFEVLARHVKPAAVAAACCALLAQAAGPSGMVGGQSDDIDASNAHAVEPSAAPNGHARPPRESEHSAPDMSLAFVESLHARKTGALLAACPMLGALVAGANAEQQQALSTYGKKIGLAFQIIDDLLDVEGDASAIGKRVGKDSDRGKLTFPALVGVAESRRRATRLIDDACTVLVPLGTGGKALDELARYILERDR